MDELASTGRLLRHYTQNFDCLETSLDNLHSRTISLHGRLDMVICTLCQAYERVSLERYRDVIGSPCPRCTRRSQTRISRGKRGIAIRYYRPKVLLYGEPCPEDIDITTQFDRDEEEAELVVIAGTRLKIPALQRSVHALCSSIKSRGGMVIWVSREKPSLGSRFKTMFDYVFQEDCDTVV